jgi:flagellar motor switch protein FliM
MAQEKKVSESRETGGRFQPQVRGNLKAKDIIASTQPREKEIMIKLYDFKRPDKFSRDQIRTLSILHEYFSRLLATRMSGLLRCVCEVSLDYVDQMSYEEYIRIIPVPACMAIINMDPLRGSSIIQIDNTLTFSIIERLAGRSNVETPGFNRDLTDIELSIMEGMFVRILEPFRESWSTVYDSKPRLGQIEIDSQFANIVPPTEMVIVVSLNCKIQTVESRITICLPYLTLEPIVSKLTAKYWYSSVRRKPGQKPYPVSHCKADSSVFYETESLSLNQLYNLSKGSLIKLPDVKKGVVYLSCGKEPVLQLQKENGSSPRFTVVRDNKEGNITAELSFPGSQKTMGKMNEQITAAVSGVLKSVEHTLLQGYDTIEKKLKELTARQAELADQLYFGSQEKVIKDEETETHAALFQFLRPGDIDYLFHFIKREHPQMIALILANIEPFYAGDLLSRFPEKQQIDLTERIATIDRVPPEVLHEIERVLKQRLSMVDKIKTAGGIDATAEILSLTKQKAEERILKGLEKTDSNLAGAIKKKMALENKGIIQKPGTGESVGK